MRVFKDKLAKRLMQALTLLSLLILALMGAGLYYKSSAIIRANSAWELLSTSEWSPLAGKFGFLTFILGSIYVTALAILIALPVSLLTALYLTGRQNRGSGGWYFPCWIFWRAFRRSFMGFGGF